MMALAGLGLTCIELQQHTFYILSIRMLVESGSEAFGGGESGLAKRVSHDVCLAWLESSRNE